MPQEKIFADFSGGMNALAAVDKLAPNECLLAENVRLDETGNVLSAGAVTRQNALPYAASGGTNTNNVHSLYWNPSLGGIAGVGKDVFFGPRLSSFTSSLVGTNTAQQKMSFASAPGRVYFDIGSVGYWTDMNNMLTVDWPPPDAAGATVTGPTVVGTGVSTGTPAWANPNNITSTTATSFASVSARNGSAFLNATMGTNSFAISTASVTGIAVTVVVSGSGGIADDFTVTLLRNGQAVGQTKDIFLTTSAFNTYTLGGSTDLWGITNWTQADINAGNFGFQFQFIGAGDSIDRCQIYQGQMTIYQGVGFFAGTGASGTLTGTYTWKIAFVSSNGEESQASSPSASTTLTAQQGTLTGIPAGDARTTGRNIYRKGGALTTYYLVGSIGNNLATTYADNQTDITALATGVILAGDVPGDYPNTRFNQALGGAVNAPGGQGRYPVLHYDRLFWVNPKQTNQIFWSKPLNGFAYPSVNFINVGDSKPISRIISVFGELIIIKTDSIWRLTGTDETSFDLVQTPSAVGTDESFTVVALPDKVIFANRWGLWIFNGYTSQPLTTKLDLWFKQLDRTGKQLFGASGFHPPEVASTTVPLAFEAIGNSEKAYIAYAEAGQPANNAVLVFDFKHGNITKRTTGGQPLSLAIDPVNGYVYMGDNAGFVSLLDDWNGAKQGSSNANLDFMTGYMDLARGSNKALWALEFFINTNGQSLTPTIYYDNGAASEVLPAISATALQRIVRDCEATASRKMQNFAVRFNGSISSINVAGTPQIQLVHVKALYDVRTGRARTGQ